MVSIMFANTVTTTFSINSNKVSIPFKWTSNLSNHFTVVDINNNNKNQNNVADNEVVQL